MDKKRIREIVEFLEKTLRQNGVEPVRVVLFGSHNGGMPSETSDVDVFIISNVFGGKDIFQRSEMTASSQIAFIEEFVVPLDLINLTPKEFEEDPTYAAMIANA